MYKKIIGAFSALMLSTGVFMTTDVDAASLDKRLAGSNRYETGSKIVQEGWTTSDYAVIASGEGFADALCAAPLAKKYNAPILLTGKTSLDSNTENELESLNVKNVFIVGGPGVVSDSIEFKLQSMGITTTRIYGQNRFETSLQVAKNLGETNEVIVTNGFGFADALSIAPVAAQKGMPILLTDKGDLPTSTKDFLANSSYSKSYIVGGSGVVSDKIASQLKDNTRLGGASRYGTNAAVLNQFAGEFSYDKVYVASGENYPDALSGSALAALSNSPLILLGTNIDSSVMSSVKAKHDQYNNVIVLGGTAVISEASANSIVNGEALHVPSGLILKDTNKPLIYTGVGAVPSNELWVTYLDGTEELLVSSRSAKEMKDVIASIHNPQFSPDKKKVYFRSAAWTTSGAIHVVDIETKSEHFVCAGNTFKVIESGTYAGKLIVNQHRYYGAPNYGAYNNYFLIDEDGTEIKDLGDSDEVLNEY